MTSPLIEVQDLRVQYGGRTVMEVGRFAIQPREVVTLVGPNGAGKSTLMRVLALLEAPTRGLVRFAGTTVQYRSAELLALRRRMATVFQAPLLCDTSVQGNVALPLRFRRLAGTEIDRRVGPWLERFGIAHLARRPAKRLSGGEAQRVSLARAFVLEPELLFLDEPFGALDAPTRESLLLDLQAALRESGTTTVFVTHDRSEALMLGDRLAVVMGGRIHQVDTPQAVFSAPSTEEVARFVGADTIIPGVVRAHRDGLCLVTVGSGEIQVDGDAPPGERLLVCLRPEDVVLSAPVVHPPASLGNAIPGKVRRIIPLGAQVRVEVDAGVSLRALITKQSLADLGLHEGDEVWACFKPAVAHLIRRREVDRLVTAS
jgi:tungstate transport system ATP-binding protein